MIKLSVKNIIDTLRANRLFSAVKNEDLTELASKYCTEKSYKKGSVIFPKNSSEKCIGIIVKGVAQVEKEHIVVSRLNPSDIFGAVTLYGQSETFVNDISAITDCKVAFFSKEGIDTVLSKSPRFAKRYIEYLSQRIYFLNKKIETYTLPTVEEKLYAYLSSARVGDTVDLSIKMTELACQLNLSRASLYRAFDELEQKGKIVRDGKRIRIIS